MEERLVLTVGMAIGLGFSVGCQGPAGLSDADRTAIRQADANDMKLMNAKDWKGDVALFTDDAILLPPNGAAVQGKVAIQTWMEAFPPFSNFQEQSLEIEGQGDFAYDRGTYSMTVTPPGAAPIEDHGKYLTIWHSRLTGRGRLRAECSTPTFLCRLRKNLGLGHQRREGRESRTETIRLLRWCLSPAWRRKPTALFSGRALWRSSTN
jgi:ketosteroid isomerase-like protein